jgi:hypothetical protein
MSFSSGPLGKYAQGPSVKKKKKKNWNPIYILKPLNVHLLLGSQLPSPKLSFPAAISTSTSTFPKLDSFLLYFYLLLNILPS